MRSMINVLFALIALAAPATAADITYHGAESFGGATADLTLTTDGVIGAVFKSDIVRFLVTVRDGGGTTTFDNSDGEVAYVTYAQVAQYGQFNLTATTAALSFDFSDSPIGGIELLFQEGSIGNGGAFLCYSSNGCWGGSPSYSEIGANSQPSTPGLYGGLSGGLAAESAYPSTEVIATAPEPAAWALLLGGFGIVGGAIRNRRLKLEAAS